MPRRSTPTRPRAPTAPDSEFYEQSLYKLGWSLFKQSENEASFEPFVRVLDLKLR